MVCLKDFEKELNKCSKCGLCEAVCPLFKLTPNDCVASKGKFTMLHGITKGDLEFTKNIDKYIDTCLKCGKCNSFCPSGIDVCHILSIAKYEYMKTTLKGKIINFIQSKTIFNMLLKIGAILSKPFRPQKKMFKTEQAATKVVYFKGCVNKIYPRTDIYINKIFKNHNIEIIEPNFECCGLPFLSEGNLTRFNEVAEHNLENLNLDYDYLVTDCASCENTILSYPKYISTQYKIKDEKSINWGDLIAAKSLKFKFKTPIRITFHKPCHLDNDSFFEKIISNCENVEYIKMDKYDDCCGLAGSFTLKNRKLSTDLSRSKAKNIVNANVDYVVTTCPACILGLAQGLLLEKNNTKIVSLLELLAMAEVIN